MAIVVAVHGDEAAQDEEVRNRATEAGPESVPGSRLSIRTGVAQKPGRRVTQADRYDYEESDENEQPNGETPFHGVTPDLSPSQSLQKLVGPECITGPVATSFTGMREVS